MLAALTSSQLIVLCIGYTDMEILPAPNAASLYAKILKECILTGPNDYEDWQRRLKMVITFAQYDFVLEACTVGSECI